MFSGEISNLQCRRDFLTITAVPITINGAQEAIKLMSITMYYSIFGSRNHQSLQLFFISRTSEQQAHYEAPDGLLWPSLETVLACFLN